MACWRGCEQRRPLILCSPSTNAEEQKGIQDEVSAVIVKYSENDRLIDSET